MYKQSNVEILCILSELFNGNKDIIQLIYNKKTEIEKNEILFYYLVNGWEHGRIICYGELFLNSIFYNRSEFYKKYQKNINSFISSFSLSKVSNFWTYQKEKELYEDKRFYMKVIMNCFYLDNFIKVRLTPSIYNSSECPNYETELFRRPTIKEKTNTINLILEKKGIFYLDLIRLEYSYGDLDHCIILNENGKVETVFGGTCGINYSNSTVQDIINS